jgi:hypothetical protein
MNPVLHKQQNTDDAPFDSWAIVEIFGHQRYAGHVSEQLVAGAKFIRIDVPEQPPVDAVKHSYYMQPAQPAIAAFTKLVTQGAIFSITPCSEQVARRAAVEFRSKPMASFDCDIPMLESKDQKQIGFDETDDMLRLHGIEDREDENDQRHR